MTAILGYMVLKNLFINAQIFSFSIGLSLHTIPCFFEGTVSRDFRPFFCLKDSTKAPYVKAKTVTNFLVFWMIFERKRGHSVHVVVDYTTVTQCKCDYTDTRFSRIASR